MFSLEDVELTNASRVLVREDYNVPLANGEIVDATRIQRSLPTINRLLKAKAKIILMSHLGRPSEGKFAAQYSLRPVADYLQQELDMPVQLLDLPSLEKQAGQLQSGQIYMLENTRFLIGEKTNDSALAKRLAQLADVFVMDAFAVAHRKHASSYGVAQYAKYAVAGPLLLQELGILQQALLSPQKPVVAIVGGSKVSTKLAALHFLLDKVDTLVLGGGIANTFLQAQNYNIGNSLVEADLVPTAQEILAKAEKLNKKIWLPEDVIVAKQMTESAQTRECHVDAVNADESIFDIGTKSRTDLDRYIQSAKTILWNGPLGVFELSPFQAGTEALSNSIAKSTAFSVAGGGDTLAAVEKFNISQQVDYLSTGGGAFLAMLEGETLAAQQALELKHNSQQSQLQT